MAVDRVSALVGERVSHYRIVEKIGEGGMGHVFLAWDASLNRRVALKVLSPDVAANSERLLRFYQEARAAAALTHPNVATIHEVNEDNGVYFIAMEYVEGETIKAKIANNALGLKELHSCASQIANALEAAHSKGIVHRDLKPGNIMVTPRGQVKLLDFGLAKQFKVGDSSITSPGLVETNPGSLLGTVEYMSPEQALGHKIDHRSDIFSLGVILYEAATGLPPFRGTTAIETINRIINVDPHPVGDLNPLIPTFFERIILKCLAKNPEGRYQTATAFLEDLSEDLTKPERASAKDRVPPIRRNLPRQLTNFVGREREIAEVEHLLGGMRLLTLMGPGGIGKTRLAIQVAVEKIGSYLDGVWFVDLGALSDESLIASAIASTLGIQDESPCDALQSICDYFERRNALLVVDNCEHMVVACGKIIDSLLQRCENLSILATSREPLMIAGESVFRVPCLSVPDRQYPAEGLLQFEALRLFVDRATAVRSEFVLDSTNAGDVVAVCCQLDGIPLAIELAAARSRALSIQEIRTRLTERLRLLTMSTRTAVPRQQTLRATLDWSHNLLSEKEQILFRRICLFVGGFTLQAVEDVSADDRLEQHEITDLLTQLVDKSLVVFAPNISMRYRLLETIREYSREKLSESREADAIRKRHADFYLRFVEPARYELLGERQQEWFHLVASDYDNIRSAFQWFRSQPDGTAAMLKIVTAIRQFWLVRGDYSEGREWANAALERAGEPRGMQHIGAMETAGDLANAQGDHDAARDIYECILKIAQAHADGKWIGTGLFSLAKVAYSQCDFQRARMLFEESLSAWRRAEYRLGVAGALGNLGHIAYVQANYSVAQNYFEQSLAGFRELRATEGIASLLMSLGHLAYIQGDYAQTRALVEDSLASVRAIGSKPRVARALSYLSDVAAASGDLGSARSLIEQSLEIARELGAKTQIALFLNTLGNIASLEKKYCEARSLYEEGLSIAKAVGDKLDAAHLATGLANIAKNEGRCDAALHLQKQSLTTFREIGFKVGMVRSLNVIAVTFVANGDLERAAHLFGAIESLYQAMGILPPPSEIILFGYKGAAEIACQILGEEEFVNAKSQGRDMTLEQAMEYALKSL